MRRRTTVKISVRQRHTLISRIAYVLLALFLAFMAYGLIVFEEAHIAGGICALMSLGGFGSAMGRYRD